LTHGREKQIGRTVFMDRQKEESWVNLDALKKGPGREEVGKKKCAHSKMDEHSKKLRVVWLKEGKGGEDRGVKGYERTLPEERMERKKRGRSLVSLYA